MSEPDLPEPIRAFRAKGNFDIGEMFYPVESVTKIIAAERARADALEAVLKTAATELQEIVEWTLVEKAPLRKQEIDSISSVIATARALLGAKTVVPRAEPVASDVPREVLLDKTLRQYAHDCRIAACGAWSDVRDPKGDLDEAKCAAAQAHERRLRDAINELAELAPPLPSAPDTVRVPRTREEAAMMVRLGSMFLEAAPKDAPEPSKGR